MGFFLKLKKDNAQNKEDMNIEVKQIHDAAEQGDPEAQYKLALRYLEGDGVKKNEKTAAAWLEKAAAQDHKEAMKKLSWCYLYGHGVKQSLSYALELGQKADGTECKVDTNKFGALVRK